MVKNIDEYIAEFPTEVQIRLKLIRQIVRKIVPEVEEKISYGMPTFYLKKNLIHFAGFKNHIGLYPLPPGIEKFKDELKEYKQGKGSVQFPHDKPLPIKLIEDIVKFRVKEN